MFSFNTIALLVLVLVLVFAFALLLVIAITSEFGVCDPDGARELRADNCLDCDCDGDCVCENACISSGGVGADDAGRLETTRFAGGINDCASGNCNCPENCC